MADAKVTALTALAGADLASADLFLVVDVSDTTMDATGTDKKITKTELTAGLGIDALTGRVNTISNFASPNAGGVVSGNFYDNSFQATASSTLIGAANRIELAPYYSSVDLSIDQIGVAVSTGVAASTVKLVIYAAGTDGWPAALLYESAAQSSATSSTYANASLTFTFSKGTIYWVGVRHSATATLRTINTSSAVNLGLSGSGSANYYTTLRRTLTYATAATDPWSFVSGDLTANITPPSIRFRAA